MKSESLLVQAQPFTANLEYVGIDRIRFMYDTMQEYSDGYHALFTQHFTFRTAKKGVMLTSKGSFGKEQGCEIYVELRNNGNQVLVDFNPSRLFDPDGDTLCPVDKLEAAVLWVVRELSYAVVPNFGYDAKSGEIFALEEQKWPKDWKRHITLTRLDVARDIYSPFRSFGVKDMASISKKRYKNDVLYRNSGQIQTLSWGSSSSVRYNFYNKSKQHHNDPEGGWFRLEAQIHTQYLKTLGFRTLDGVVKDRVEAYLWDRFYACNLNSVLTLAEGSFELAARLHNICSEVKCQTFIGLAYSMEYNLPISMNERTVDDYRKIGVQVGFHLGQSVTNFGSKRVGINFADGVVEEIP
jgi:hypothetical protein